MAPSKRTTSVTDSNLLLKGYLPVRVRFTSTSGGEDVDEHETFFYVKEHKHKKGADNNGNTEEASSSSANQPTLFVANAPSFPPIDTPTMLKSLLGRYGNIKRVTVVPNPRGGSSNSSTIITDPTLEGPSYFSSTVTDRFAHVVFETPKDLQKCYKALVRVMSSSLSSDGVAALVVDAVERQTLADALAARQKEEEDNDDNDDAEQDNEELEGIHKVLHCYRTNCQRHQQRDVLLEECNAVMEAYEVAEQARLRAISSEPDEDGFITVTHSTQPTSTSINSNEGLELQANGDGRPRHHAAKGRSRKRKKGPGAASREDFYRFQGKAKRKEDIQDLRSRFQEDLQRIQKLKETKGGFKPFG